MVECAGARQWKFAEDIEMSVGTCSSGSLYTCAMRPARLKGGNKGSASCLLMRLKWSHGEAGGCRKMALKWLESGSCGEGFDGTGVL
eukprot:scaffold55049_cov22-Tisochrysis_lutea.AAC.1